MYRLYESRNKVRSKKKQRVSHINAMRVTAIIICSENQGVIVRSVRQFVTTKISDCVYFTKISDCVYVYFLSETHGSVQLKSMPAPGDKPEFSHLLFTNLLFTIV